MSVQINVMYIFKYLVFVISSALDIDDELLLVVRKEKRNEKQKQECFLHLTECHKGKKL